MCPPAPSAAEPAPDHVALIQPARVGVVVPAWNETGKIGDVVRKVPRRWAATVIVVDDHSGDDTAAEARAALVSASLAASWWLPRSLFPSCCWWVRA